MTTRALVLGGGGITGIAWETGLLAGLAEAGLDLTAADRVIGTSAGSIVGSQITGTTGLEELYARQLLPPASLGDASGQPSSGGAPLASIGVSVTLRFGVALLKARGDLEAFGRILGERSVAAAAAGKTPTVDERYEQVRKRLTESEWPDRDLRIVAVDVESGKRAVFGGPSGDPSGVSLEDAVNASCAVPLVYPPIPIGDRRFVDGGVHSTANADLATGCEVVVALCPLDRGIGPLRSATQQLEALEHSSGVRHLVVQPDAASREAIGGNVLDPEARPPSARAGHAQAVSLLEELGALWG